MPGKASIEMYYLEISKQICVSSFLGDTKEVFAKEQIAREFVDLTYLWRLVYAGWQAERPWILFN